jgi:hypothetical protein
VPSNLKNGESPHRQGMTFGGVHRQRELPRTTIAAILDCGYCCSRAHLAAAVRIDDALMCNYAAVSELRKGVTWACLEHTAVETTAATLDTNLVRSLLRSVGQPNCRTQ